MKSKGMTFSDWSVRALLDGTKTMTRRVVNRPKWADPGWPYEVADYDPNVLLGMCMEFGCMSEIQPPHLVGSHVYVREPWRMGLDDIEVIYRADYPNGVAPGTDRWRSPLFMPRWAARIWLTITEARVEQLQSISEEDAGAEGTRITINEKGQWLQCCSRRYVPQAPTFREHFVMEWEEINAKRGHSWATNPWVWVYGLKVARWTQAQIDQIHADAATGTQC